MAETPDGWESRNRPPVEQRWVAGDGVFEGRTEPSVLRVRSRWLYSPADPKMTADPLARAKGSWAFARGVEVVESDFPPPYAYAHMNDLHEHLHRMLSSYGDDVDLVIEVRLARPEEASDGS